MQLVAETNVDVTVPVGTVMDVPKNIPKYGDRTAVWEGRAIMTKGGLTKNDLTLNVHGKPCSKKSQARGIELQKQLSSRQYNTHSATSSNIPTEVTDQVKPIPKKRGRKPKHCEIPPITVTQDTPALHSE